MSALLRFLTGVCVPNQPAPNHPRLVLHRKPFLGAGQEGQNPTQLLFPAGLGSGNSAFWTSRLFFMTTLRSLIFFSFFSGGNLGFFFSMSLCDFYKLSLLSFLRARGFCSVSFFPACLGGELKGSPVQQGVKEASWSLTPMLSHGVNVAATVPLGR